MRCLLECSCPHTKDPWQHRRRKYNESHRRQEPDKRNAERDVDGKAGDGTGRRRDEQFATICAVARDYQKPVRIGVNGGSLNQELVLAKMQENTDRRSTVGSSLVPARMSKIRLATQVPMGMVMSIGWNGCPYGPASGVRGRLAA
mgnify:CR=1 FL=1